jgi:hypothetical protein
VGATGVAVASIRLPPIQGGPGGPRLRSPPVTIEGMSALAVVILGAVLGGVIQTLNAARDRKREGRAAAIVIAAALAEAHGILQRAQTAHATDDALSLTETGPGNLPVRELSAHLGVWEAERKSLARVMASRDYHDVSRAFEALGSIVRDKASDPSRPNNAVALASVEAACTLGRNRAYSYARLRAAALVGLLFRIYIQAAERFAWRLVRPIFLPVIKRYFNRQPRSG